MKIIGIGLNKTGTTTLGVCFKFWGFNHISFCETAFNLYINGDYESLLGLVGRYDSFEDWPWPMIYNDIDKKYPGSKFILTVRKDSDIWYQSLCEHAKRTGPTKYRMKIYGYEMPNEYEREHIQFYENHNKSVREYFKDRPQDLLEVCWETGDGWRELAEFLNLDIPRIPFPHANKSPLQ